MEPELAVLFDPPGEMPAVRKPQDMSEDDKATGSIQVGSALADRSVASLAGEAADMAQSTVVTGAVAALLVVVSVPVALALGARYAVGRLLSRGRKR